MQFQMLFFNTFDTLTIFANVHTLCTVSLLRRDGKLVGIDIRVINLIHNFFPS